MSMPVFRCLIYCSLLLLTLPGFSADYYWVGGAGNWSDTNHWATTSGGTTFHLQAPTAEDDVFFDGNSFTGPDQVVTVDVAEAFCRDMIWSGATGTPVLRSAADRTLHLYGSLTFIAEMSVDFTGTLRFESTPLSAFVREIATAGQLLPGDVLFDGNDGQWALAGDLEIGGTLTLERGTLGTDDHTLTCARFISDNALSRRLNLTRSRMVLQSPDGDTVRWTARADNFTLEARNAAIEFRDPARMDNTGDGFLEYHDLTFQADAVIDCSNFVDLRIDTLRAQRNLTLQNDMQIISLELGRGYECRFRSGSNFIIRQLLAEGGCEGYVSLRSTIDGQAAFIQSAFDFTNSYLILRDIHNAGTTTFLADNSIDLGNNDGWIINSPDPRTLYWVDNGGNWYDTDHWSLSSGGPGGECPPTPLDDIIFDGASFTIANQVVMGGDGQQFYAHDMTWLPGTRTPTLQLPALQLFGSLQFDAPLNTDLPLLHLRGDEAGNTLTFAMQELQELRIEGSGAWTIQDPLTARLITHLRGALNTNGQPVEIERYNAFGEPEKNLALGNSRLLVTGDGSGSPSWNVLAANLTIAPSTSLIELLHPNAYLRTDLSAGSAAYHRVLFSNGSGTGTLEGGGAVIGVDSLRFAGNGRILGDHRFGVLDFTVGRSYRLEAGATQTIERAWNLRGNPCAVISLFSTLPGSRTTVQSDNAVINADYVRIQDQQAIGSASFNAGRNGSNLGNNSGWTFPGEEGAITDGFLGADRVLCNPTLTLDADNGTDGERYAWSDGSSEAQLLVDRPGDYWVEVTFPQDCRVRDTVTVYGEEVLRVELPPDTTLCSGESLLLDATLSIPNITYEWQNGSTDPTFTVTQPGAYAVTTELAGCQEVARIEVMVVPTPDVDLGPDQLLCADETALLDASNAGAENYLWSDASTGPTLRVDQAGIYWVEAVLNGCRRRDSIQIGTVSFPDDLLGADTTACEGERVVLDATVPYPDARYTWNDGSTQPQLAVAQSGLYQVAVVVGNCQTEDEVEIAFNPAPVFELGQDALLCEGASYDLFISVAADAYRWSDGSTGEDLTVTYPGGLVWGEATLGSCSFRDSIFIEYQAAPRFDLGPDTAVCAGRPLRLAAGISADRLLWSTGSTAPSIEVSTPGLYWLQVEEGICTIRDSIVVEARECVFYEAYIPNAFSPNGDGVNDLFQPFLTPDLQIDTYRFAVFDRWGNQVFETTDPNQGWDGTFRGRELPAGVYVYFVDIDFTDEDGAEQLTESGEVAILR